MKRFRQIKYFFSLCAVFMFALPAYSQTSSGVTYPAARTDFSLTLKDGVILDCSEFKPETVNTGGLPAVIFLHGFGGSKDDVNPFAENLAKYGYCTFSYSMRGQGKSTGLSNLISTTEMNDLMQVINFVKSRQEVNPGRIALTGSSQGGILAFMAACSGADVRCIVADLASPEFASSWIENGCVKMTLLWSLSYDSTVVRYSGGVKNLKRWILSDRKDKWDSLETYLPAERDFVTSLDKMNIPMLASNSWQDKFFNTYGMIKASDVISAPFKMYFGAIGGHGSDTTAEETNFHSANIMNWLDYWLCDAESVMEDLSKFTYTTGSHPIVFNHWKYTRSYSDVWPPEGTENLRLYFSRRNSLTVKPAGEKTDTVSFINDVRDKSLKLADAVKSGFSGEWFNSKFTKTLIYFETEPLEKNLLFTGTPLLNLVYASTANFCQYNFQIWEVKPGGEMNFVTRINYTDRHCNKNSIAQKILNGISHSHLFQKGYKIRIYVTNIDNGPSDNFLGNSPHVIPVLKRARNYIFLGGESFIELPVRYE